MRKANFTIATKVWGLLLALTLMAVSSVSLSAQCSLTCNNLVQISLDQDCSVTLDDDMILEGNPAQYCPGGNFQVQAKINNVWVPASGNFTATSAHINQTIQVRVRDLVSGQSCWGYITVEDKLAPVVSCVNARVPCAATNFSPDALNALGVANAYPTATDNCSAVTRSYTDTWFDLPCGTVQNGNLSGYYSRVWAFSDASGNTNTCTQLIFVDRINVGNVSFPADVTVSCTNPTTSPSTTGAPFFFSTVLNRNFPLYPEASYCELNVTYTDQVLPVCDGTHKILRTWVVYDWCLPTNQTSNPKYFIQLIKVVDEVGPTIAPVDDVTVSTNSNTCCATVDLPNVIVSDACSRIRTAVATIYGYDQYTGALIGTFTVNGTLTSFPGNNFWIPDTLANFGYTACLPIGTHEVVYTITDDCGNASTVGFDLTVEDQTPPTAVGDEFTQTSLGVDGMVFVNASSLDNGSYDNCGPVYFKARRMNANPVQTNALVHDQVKFDCSDIGTTVQVILRVYDVDPGPGSKELDFLEGDYDEVMINVLVDDKFKPTCSAPANVTVSCEAFDPSLWAYGQATATDNCSNPTITSTVVLTQFDSLCNKGTITRRWTVVDAAGNSSQCSQRIIVTYNQNYWVKFPADRLVSTCDGTTAYGAPEFYGEDCELLATSYTDEFFTVIPDACFKIERTWRIINWCAYNPNLPASNALNVYVPNPNPNNTTNHPTNLPGVTVSPAGTTVAGWVPTSVRINPTDPQPTNYSLFWTKEANSYTYKQIIKVFDTQDPVVQCPASPVEFCDLSANDPQFYNATQYWDNTVGSHDLCEGDANIEITATDACSGANLSFRYLLFLDLDGNGSMESVINSVNPPGFNNINYNNINNANFAGGTPWAFDFRPVAGDRKWGFGLQVDAANGNSRTARVRWFNQANNPAAGAVPQLPYGTHKIKWFVEDGCGNETVCEYTIVVKDCKKPTVVCINGLSVNLMNISGGMIQLWASDFLQYTEDNCTPASKIKIGIRRKGAADGQGATTGFPKNADGTPQTGVAFTCADLGTQLVELWGLDLAGNADYCETYVLIQDNAGVCGPIGGMATVAGALKTDANQGVEDAAITLTSNGNGIPSGSIFTIATGNYTFSNALPLSSNATVTPSLELDPLNGVNTWDLILISRHILGLEPLNTPYKLISADVNKSGTVTTFDIVEARKLILGTYTKLPANSSWRFVDKSQVFTNPANPFADVIKENLSIANIQTNFMNGDFVAAKVGDVDGSATPNNLVSSDDRTTGTLFINAADRKVAAGEEVLVTFDAAEKNGGYQFTMNLNGLEVMDIVPGANTTTDNFAIFGQSAITTSIDANAGAFSVKFRAAKAGQLSEMLSVSSRITKAVAFSTEGAAQEVAIRFNGATGTVAAAGFELFQNTPNPVKGATVVSFNLPTAGEATLTITNAEGRIVKSVSGAFVKGLNSVTINRSDLQAGILFYQVNSGEFSAVKKMIVVE